MTVNFAADVVESVVNAFRAFEHQEQRQCCAVVVIRWLKIRFLAQTQTASLVEPDAALRDFILWSFHLQYQESGKQVVHLLHNLLSVTFVAYRRRGGQMLHVVESVQTPDGDDAHRLRLSGILIGNQVAAETGIAVGVLALRMVASALFFGEGTVQ